MDTPLGLFQVKTVETPFMCACSSVVHFETGPVIDSSRGVLRLDRSYISLRYHFSLTVCA